MISRAEPIFSILSDRPQIFERFHRLKGYRGSDSVGLGLYITRMLVEAHGGRIWLECPPEGGSIFSFSLPVATGETDGRPG